MTSNIRDASYEMEPMIIIIGEEVAEEVKNLAREQANKVAINILEETARSLVNGGFSNFKNRLLTKYPTGSENELAQMVIASYRLSFFFNGKHSLFFIVKQILAGQEGS